ncbi:MAG: hypothetical protein JWP12_2916 [Bacteroidetes bacterium]|nr:hypothetical protein [Bacteroidota bacterium]
MKRAASILLLGLTVSVNLITAQNTANTTEVKPSTDACPNWNKKQPESKANYFAYLRKSPAARKQNGTTNQYAGNTYYHPVSMNTNPERAVPSNNFSEPRYRKTAQTNSRTNPAPATEPPKVKDEVKEEAKTPAPAPPETKKTEEKVTVPEQKTITEKKTTDAAPEKTETAVNASKPTNVTKENTVLKSKRPNVKKDKSVRVKKTKFKKNRAAKCPSF